ncbi:hypothetical protein EBR66_01690 [bacterium]|nr:hypothetical protein [bacterium]
MQSQNIKIHRDETLWEVEVQADIPADVLTSYRSHALKEITRTAKVDGFREGKAPENLILQRVGETAVLREAAELAVKHELPEILAQEKLPIVDTPRVTTSQPETGKDLHITARAPLAPEITLPDYKKIAANVNGDKREESVSDKEHSETLLHFRRERVRIEHVESGLTPEEAAQKAKDVPEQELPILDDTFVKPFGYENIGAFESAVRENLLKEKELRAQQERRAKILDEISKKATVKYPIALKEYELDDMEARLSADLESMGATFEKYLADTKKTREVVRKEWESAADSRAKTRLILAEIARIETLEPDVHAIDHELKHAQKHYPKANPEVLRANIFHSLRNEKVIEFLEGQQS